MQIPEAGNVVLSKAELTFLEDLKKGKIEKYSPSYRRNSQASNSKEEKAAHL
jgi:hypothetical protein